MPVLPTPPCDFRPARRHLLGAGLGSLGLLLAGRGARAADGLKFFQIGTGTTGGTYFQIGSTIANAISNPPGSRPCERGGPCGVPGLIVVAQASSGAVENVLAMREGRMESGLVQADIAHMAFVGQGAFAGQPPFADLRAIANLYTETIHVVVRADSGIASLADLKGRRVALGEKGSGTIVSTRLLLSAYGLSEKAVKPLYLSPGAAADRLATGEVDAFFIIGGSPLPAIADLAMKLPIALVPLDDAKVERMVRRMPLFTPATIEAEMYPGVAATATLGVGAQWLVRGGIAPDLIYGITRALWHPNARRLLDEGHPRAAAIRLETALHGLAVPLHPGAERFYREAGLKVETAEMQEKL